MFKLAWYRSLCGVRGAFARVATRCLCAGLLALPICGFAQSQVEDLRCEYLHSPLGIDAVRPRLSWIIRNEHQGGITQMAYQVLVSSSQSKLNRNESDLWDSGKCLSNQSTQIEYNGQPLKSRQRCYWKVRVWDNLNSASPWSTSSSWTMGLLKSSDWIGDWIGVSSASVLPDQLAVPRYLRRDFNLEANVRRATVYVTALGLYELRINGKRVGRHLLAPEWTNYFKRVQYQTFDVTSLLRNGKNAIGAVLGNGWYSGGWQQWKSKLKPIYGDQPFLRMQLEVEGNDGKKTSIATDSQWCGTDNGPLRFSGIYEGETCDARKDFPGWDTPKFTGEAWPPVEIGHPRVGQLVSQRSEPIEETRVVKPISVTEPKPGTYVFDLGQNLAGWCKFRMREAAGTTIVMQFNEVLNPDGTVYMDNLHAGHLSTGDRQIDRYVCRGNGEEVFEPHFTYHGFRFIQVTGLSKKPDLKSLSAIVFHNAFKQVGTFLSSNPTLNRLALNIQWSQRSNMMGVPTDCCQRDERCGYTGDGQFFAPTAVYNFDVAAFFNKWLVDVCEDSQMPGGWFADHAPTFGPGDGWNVGWSDAGVICPYIIWQTYGDTQVIRDHYAAMKRNMVLLKNTSPTLLHRKPVGNGDWLNLGGGASSEVVGTAYDAYDFKLMAEMAKAIGQKTDAEEYQKHSQAIMGAFLNAYVNADGSIKDSSQTGFALAFTMGLVPNNLKSNMSDKFVAEVKRFDWHLATGFIGTPRLLPALHLAGRDDVAYRLLLQDTYPSWLYPVKLGATTTWERWDGWLPEKGFQDSGMNSFNHYSFGAVGEYMYGNVGGIRPLSPGYQTFCIEPEMGKGLDWANVSYDSIHGKIVSNWKVSGKSVSLHVEVPTNTKAIVYVPTINSSAVAISAIQGTPRVIKFLRMEGRKAVFEVGSGKYDFHSIR